MRKISKTRGLGPIQDALELRDARPIRIAGATITSWPGPIDVDLGNLFAHPASGPSVTGGATDRREATIPANNEHLVEKVPKNRRRLGTVSLSDGTQITFATASQFETVE
jgi:hypothetical protein